MSKDIIIMETGDRRPETGDRRPETGDRRPETGDRPVVSFCVPVYNKAEVALKIVRGLLVSEDPRFEVIASDNASTDNTQEVLSQIQDPRFRYHRNPTNVGAHMNWLKSLELGRGEWLYFVIGRDKVNGEHITRLIELLEWARRNGVTLLYDGYTENTEPVIYFGIGAMIYFIGTHHPTGTIFKRDLFVSIPDKEYYFTHSDMHPENYLRHDLLLKGNGALIRSGTYIYPSSLVDRVKVKSTVENGGNVYDMFYSPRHRTAQFYEMIEMIDNLEQETFSTADKDKFFRRKFYALLLSVSFGWRGFCKDFVWQSHYGQEVRRVGVNEMIRNIFKAYRDTKAHLEEKGTMTLARQRIMRRCMLKVFTYEPPKRIARKILKPLGVWDWLKRWLRGY